MPKIKINNVEIEVADGLTAIQACEIAGIEIPRFCYHEKLKISGNCRMCLIEMEKSPKPVASCTLTAFEGMSIHTNTEMVQKARQGVIEYLLMNHPLDCPICDQGGMCDLQDQAMLYGRGDSRFKYYKRAVKKKNFGPLIQTHMTRCIHCTRCVRFMEDIAGTSELGAFQRGENMEIDTYNNSYIESELSGNIIDLCPVGALTSKPYEFRWRNWELHNTHTIDAMDAVGSNIIVSSKSNKIYRVLPIDNPNINQGWISNKTRFFYDGLQYQRLDKFYKRKEGSLVEVSKTNVMNDFAKVINEKGSKKTGVIVGDLVDVESMVTMKSFMDAIKSPNYDCRQNESIIGGNKRSSYLFNTGIDNIESADHCLIVGANPRYEATIVNLRIGQAVREGGLVVDMLGQKSDLTYPYNHLGSNPWILKQIAEGAHPVCSKIKKSKKPMLILGEELTAGPDASTILYYCNKLISQHQYIQNDWCGFNVLHKVASRVGGLDFGITPSKNGLATKDILSKCDVIILMGADEVDLTKINKKAFVIYMGHHGDNIASIADLIIPIPAFTERDGFFINMEGRLQRARRVVMPPKNSVSESDVFFQLANMLDVKLEYSSIEDVRNYITSKHDSLSKKDYSLDFSLSNVKQLNFSLDVIQQAKNNYYLSNVICRNSIVMRSCENLLNK